MASNRLIEDATSPEAGLRSSQPQVGAYCTRGQPPTRVARRNNPPKAHGPLPEAHAPRAQSCLGVSFERICVHVSAIRISSATIVPLC